MIRSFRKGYKVWPVRGVGWEDCWICEPVKLTKQYDMKPHQMRFAPACLAEGEDGIRDKFRMISFDEPVLDKQIRHSRDAAYVSVYYLGFLVQA